MAAQPMLQNILGQLGNAPLNATGGQTAAVNQIAGEAGSTPSFAGQGTGAVNNLFNTNTQPQQGMLTGAYGQAAGALSPMLAEGYTNPYTNPAFSGAMKTLNSDITNQIGSEFTAAGRPVGTNADSSQAIARGLAQGEGGLLANEFNTLTSNQMGAAGQLTGAAGSTASGVTGQQQVPLQNAVQGIGAAGAIPGLITQPGTTNLTAANLQAGLPTMNLAGIEGLTNPIAGLGAQSTGTTTGTTSQQSPWYTTALGAGLGGLGLLGSMGGAGGIGAGAGAVGGGLSSMLGALGPLALLSDERVKENKQQVGMLYDETPVFAYNYINDPTPRIGLMAQDIETRRPDAVVEFGGIKAVDYGKATERARMLSAGRSIGMLADMDMAA